MLASYSGFLRQAQGSWWRPRNASLGTLLLVHMKEGRDVACMQVDMAAAVLS